MKIPYWSAKKVARDGGGLFLGLQIYFPTSIVDDSVFPWVRCKQITASVGLIFWRITFSVNWGHHTEGDRC